MLKRKIAWLWVLICSITGLYSQAMPPGLPTLKIDWYKDTTVCNYIFMSSERFVLPATLQSAALIFDRHGAVVWYMPSQDNLYGFFPQANGKLSFAVHGVWYELDSTMTADTIATCPNSGTDFHDFIHLADGRTLSLCSEDTVMDLRALHTYSGQQGDSAATVQYAVVEDRNASGQLLKKWRAIDHFSPADVDSLTFLYPWYMELNHTNSIDYDGQNLLLCHRSNHEVTLVKWSTGQVLWRLGGPNNDFYFLGDGGFHSQHDARFAGPGRISVFDNRTNAAVNSPRGVVYSVDSTLWLATKLYDRIESNSESPTMGSFRELSNGDALVSWGQILPEERPNISYYQANGQKVCDWHFQDQHFVYRAVCGELPFEIEKPHIFCTQQNGHLILQAQGSYPHYQWSTGDTTAMIQVADTGYYQLYVASGVGFAGSNVLRVRNPNGDCPSTIAEEPQPFHRIPKLIGTFDLFGRSVNQREQGQIYLERYDNGLSRKIVVY